MKKIDDSNIMLWIGKFLAGETSCSEERKLYEYFSKEKLPVEAEPYREMMMWYAGGMNKPLPLQNDKPRLRVRVFKWNQFIRIAAMVVAVVTLGITFMRHQIELNEELKMYEGSYIIRNGKKYTDLKEILPELKRAELYVGQHNPVIPSADDMLAEIVFEDIDEKQREIVTKMIFE